MAEEGTPEVLAEHRLGHQVPGMRGLYAHVSDRMRAELMQALQARREESLTERAAFNPHSPVPLLDELLATQAAKKAAERGKARSPQSQSVDAFRGTSHRHYETPPRSARHDGAGRR
jgi:hypothetical protein